MNKVLYTILSIFIFTEVSFAAMSGGSSSSSSSSSSTTYSSSSSDESGPYSPTSRFKDINKWNPADFWIFNSRGLKFMEMWNKKANELKSIKSETYSASYMNLVNNQVYKLFEKNMLFPVSLKKSGASVKIVKVNDKNTNIDQIVEYDKVLLDPNNQDVQIFYNLSTYEDNKLLSKKELKAKMKTAKGGFRLPNDPWTRSSEVGPSIDPETWSSKFGVEDMFSRVIAQWTKRERGKKKEKLEDLFLQKQKT